MILLGMTRHTKKKIGKLRGGAVEHLNAAEMGIGDGRELRNKVDMYAIDAHGSTTRDNKFLVVPENTFMFFTSRSGLPAKGNTPSQDIYLSYRNESNRNSYYDRMHTQLFSSYDERVATGRPQYPKNLITYPVQLYLMPGTIRDPMIQIRMMLRLFPLCSHIHYSI